VTAGDQRQQDLFEHLLLPNDPLRHFFTQPNRGGE
jgi:hypothetical protein